MERSQEAYIGIGHLGQASAFMSARELVSQLERTGLELDDRNGIAQCHSMTMSETLGQRQSGWFSLVRNICLNAPASGVFR